HGSFERYEPPPWKLHEMEFRQQIPYGGRYWKLKEKYGDRNCRHRKPPSEVPGQTASEPANQHAGQRHCDHRDDDHRNLVENRVVKGEVRIAVAGEKPTALNHDSHVPGGSADSHPALFPYRGND